METWGEELIQRQLLGAVRNVVPFRLIASALKNKGYNRTYQQCREKIKALKKRYKDAVDRLRASGVGVDFNDDLEDAEIFVNFKYFAEIHHVLGRRAVVNPPVLLDMSDLEHIDLLRMYSFWASSTTIVLFGLQANNK